MIAQLRRELARAFAFVALVACFANLGTLFVPIYNMQLFDRVIASGSMETLVVLTLACAVGLLLHGALDWLRGCLMLGIGDRLSRRLDLPAPRAALSRGLAGEGGSAVQTLRDVNELRAFATGNAAAIPLDLLWSPILIAVLFLLHPAYGWFAVAGAALLALMGLLTDLRTRADFLAASAGANKAVAELSGVLRNNELLDGMGMLPALARRWQATQRKALARLDRAGRQVAAFSAGTRSLRLLLQGGVIALGAWLVVHHEASPGSMMGANLILARLLLPFDQLVSGWRQWVFALAAWRRVSTLLHDLPALPANDDAAPETCRLEVRDLSFTPAGLSHVSFVMEPGEAVAVVGPSAAGKSTLARLVVGVFPPTGGEVLLDGRPVRDWDRAAFGRRVGYLPQNVQLMDGTIFDNIARMEAAPPERVVAAARLAGVHETIGRLPKGYSTWIGGAGYALSGGQRQRIALARALFGNPGLVVLDEPNANLDHLGEEALAGTIRILKQAGISVLVVTHRPGVLAAVDKLLVLKNGRVAAFGPLDEVAALLPETAAAQPAALQEIAR